MKPTYPFCELPISTASHAQLRQIIRSSCAGTKALRRRTGLLNKLLHHAYDRDTGFYIPFSPTLYLEGKLPEYSRILAGRTADEFRSMPAPMQFFTNMLAEPTGYWADDFDPGIAVAPRDRVVNGGFLVITRVRPRTSRRSIALDEGQQSGDQEHRPGSCPL